MNNTQQQFMKFQIRLIQRADKILRAMNRGTGEQFIAKNAAKIRENFNTGKYNKFLRA